MFTQTFMQHVHVG